MILCWCVKTIFKIVAVITKYEKQILIDREKRYAQIENKL